MNIEFEATFPNINKDEVRDRLRAAGAELKRPEYLQKRVVFHLPSGHEIPGGWLRVRDEGNKITMSLKVVDGSAIENQKETMITVNDFGQAESLLTSIGCAKKAYQESKRELWLLDDVEITIDEWPFLEPFVEVEGASKEAVEAVCTKLGFNFNQALFCAVDTLYNLKYNVSNDTINNQTPVISFDSPNPFVKD